MRYTDYPGGGLTLPQHFSDDDNTDREDDDDDEEDEEDEEEDFDEAEKSEEEEDDDEETMEKRAKIRQFTSEIKALELAIERKRAGVQPLNPIMMVSPCDYNWVVLMWGLCRNDLKRLWRG